MSQEKIVRCPACGGWLMKAEYEGKSEVNCQNRKRCGVPLLVEIHGDKTTVTVLESKRA